MGEFAAIVWAVSGWLALAYVFDREGMAESPFPWGWGGFCMMLLPAAIGGPLLWIAVLLTRPSPD